MTTKKQKKFLKEWLSKNNYLITNVYNYYLNLVGANDPEFVSIALDAIKRCQDHQTLITINQLFGKPVTRFEDILKKQNSWEFFEYLEACERISEAVKFAAKFKDEDDLDELFSFFSRHKNNYPKEAEVYFLKSIDYHLKSTGDYHYSKIDDCVRQIKIFNKNKALIIIDNICRDYKRRINLIRLLKII